MSDKKACYLSVVVESNDDGFLARCPGIQGAFAEGDTIEEALFNCVDVVKMIGGYCAERGETLGANEIDFRGDTRLSVSIPVGIE